MDKFQCKTCSEVSTSSLMMKHLASTRHKTIIDAFTEEVIACEECQDNNIHQLQIIRFGGEDMVLLCNRCFHQQYGNDEKPSTSYSLSNGSLLDFWDKYLKVRDCACSVCGNENNLNVNPKKNVLCDDCVKNDQSAKGYISEKTGKFLYLYLGIKETSNSKKLKLKGGRRVGRGKGKGRKGARKVREPKAKKPLTLLQKMEKEALATKRINTAIESASSISLKSFKGFKAADNDANFTTNVPSGTLNRQNSKTKAKNNINGKKDTKQSNSKQKQSKLLPSSKGSLHGKTRNDQRSFGKTVTKANPTDKTSMKASIQPKGKSSKTLPSKAKQTNMAVVTSEKMKQDPIVDITANKTIHKGLKKNLASSESSYNSQSIKRNEVISNVPLKHNNSRKSQSKRASKATDEQKKTTEHNRNKLGSNPAPVKKNSKDIKKTVTRRDGNGIEKRINSSLSTSESHLGTSSSNTSLWELGWGDWTPPSSVLEKPIVKTNIEDRKHTDIQEEKEEGTHLMRFNKFVPQMTYPDLNSYLRNFSYAMFLEQKLENDFIQDFNIMWSKMPNDIVFVATFNKSSAELANILPPGAAGKKDRIPFNERQPLMLTKQDESVVWYVFVKELSVQRSKINLLLEVFPWNNVPLPTTCGAGELKILPLSAQTNRILFSMTRINNPAFIDLLVGKPIKQLKFNNRLKFTKDTFNISQMDAIEQVLNNRVTVIQGPPGTGKTSTIEEIILQLISSFHSFPILCVAASNIAIDNIAEKIMHSRPDIKILRILSDRKESEYNMEHPLGKICLHNIVYDQMPPDMKELTDKVRSGRMQELSKREDSNLYIFKNKISNKNVSQAQIIFTTNITAGGRQLKAIKEVPVVIMDESTQSSEASTLVPLSLPGIKSFVFVGDEKQLSSFSNVPQLELSLFERVLLNGSYKSPIMLDVQYRMHPKISEFPILKFYKNQLKDGVTEVDRAWPGITYPLFFYQCDRGKESVTVNRRNNLSALTYINQYECQEIVKILYKLILEKNVSLDEIGIITPYSAQRDLLSKVLLEDDIINPEGKAMEQQNDEAEFLNKNNVDYSVQSHVVNIINGLHVATVDSFQGHEKNFIIFSCVRNNAENKIGFLRDERRLNVALTRARNGLIIVGNKHVLKAGDKLWREFVTFLEDKGVIFNNLEVY
ncbi:hypothetical protein KAFR_0B02620 [Kazachstania africana CBS 2517]|uniref:Helicase ATP-binding domain-containing protein n=1 Tax=Kazachstania africana (strain ATCC 22294 / BCRC 22015 / CBS 2517 / CECT 1963 / NBRC 1671 / NRRL Y-8276) TaxID=1071382 RepID=H2AQA9_KAZAF|nr:hypothetical protein KAFR_0B02620 [Kazachstania africana CBS 2517]CCF56559.1 hypothetical protein KAFR_0B02620 [Kazachstania africana CBS 2517]